MKKIFAAFLLGGFLTIGLMSCGAAHGANCDAYGNLDDTEKIENSDMASIN